MLRLYSAAGGALTPLVRLWLQRRAARGKEDPARMEERFGHASIPRPAGRLVWLHAASVGEMQSVLTLVRAIAQRDPAIHVLITTGTVTSAAMVAQQNLPRAIHQFVPVDTAPSVRRFLDHWRPDLALWVESEFWPQLLLQTHRSRIPLLLINARLSARSLAGWQRWPRSIRRILRCFDGIFAGSMEDAARLRALGATDVAEAGNLKFDAAPLPVDKAALDALLWQIGPRPLWVAASTHANEEQMVAATHRRIAEIFPDLLTIIVPRHAVRGDELAAALRADGFTVAQRSKNEPAESSVQLYLADTMGELGTFYELSEIVFLGGSLIAHGGHNPLEPARQRCTVLSGRHVHNFADIVKQMEAAAAIRLVADPASLADAVIAAFQQPLLRAETGARAYKIVGAARGASDAILARIDALLPGGL